MSTMGIIGLILWGILFACLQPVRVVIDEQVYTVQNPLLSFALTIASLIFALATFWVLGKIVEVMITPLFEIWALLQ